MASTDGSEGESQKDQVYTVARERQDWATVWVALRAWKTFCGSRVYSGLAEANKRAADALDALKRLNDQRATR